MSYVIDVVFPAMPREDKAAWARRDELRRVYFDDTRPVAPTLVEFHRRVIAKYPDEDLDESVWGDSPLINNFAGEMAALNLSTAGTQEEFERVRKDLIEMARALDLTVFDEQDGKVFYPRAPAATGCSVAVYGVAPGFDADAVAASLALLVRSDVPTMQRLLATPGTVVKKDLDRDTAQRYHDTLLAKGCVSVVTPREPYDASDPFTLERAIWEAEQGNLRSMFSVAMHYFDRQDDPAQALLARQWAERGAAAGDAAATQLLGGCLYHGVGGAQDRQRGIQLIRQAAQQGLLGAQSQLARFLRYGPPDVQNKVEADRWYQTALEGGDANAQFEKGKECRERKDYQAAVLWFERAAKQEHTGAMNYLGDMHAFGDGVPVNYALSLPLYRASAALGDEEGIFSLANAYAYGLGVEKNEAIAVDGYGRAAKLGHMWALYELGRRTKDGIGTTADHAGGIRMIMEAAANGVAHAQVRVGILYAEGEGVPQDDATADQWFQRAAAQGDESAIDILRKRS